MATPIAYNTIRSAIKTTVAAVSGVAVVEIEQESQFSQEVGTWVGIYLVRRERDSEPLAVGTRMRYNLRFVLQVAYNDMNSIGAAISGRDTVIGNIETALIGDRTLGGTVQKSWLEGGDLISGNNQNGGFTAVGEIILVAEQVFIA